MYIHVLEQLNLVISRMLYASTELSNHLFIQNNDAYNYTVCTSDTFIQYVLSVLKCSFISKINIISTFL